MLGGGDGDSNTDTGASDSEARTLELFSKSRDGVERGKGLRS